METVTIILLFVLPVVLFIIGAEIKSKDKLDKFIIFILLPLMIGLGILMYKYF